MTTTTVTLSPDLTLLILETDGPTKIIRRTSIALSNIAQHRRDDAFELLLPAAIKARLGPRLPPA